MSTVPAIWNHSLMIPQKGTAKVQVALTFLVDHKGLANYSPNYLSNLLMGSLT